MKAGVRSGLALAGRVPQRALDAVALATAWTIVAARTSGAAQWVRNAQRVSGRTLGPSDTRAAMASYMRCFAQSFALGGADALVVDQRVHVRGSVGEVRAALAQGPVVLALTHSGSWDLAGAWASGRLGDVVTVAEKVRPQALCDAFVAQREALGIDLLTAAPGERVFDRLVAATRGRSCLVPLLADRDITGRGVEVTLAGHRALVAAGPAALAARLKAPLFPVAIAERALGPARASAAGTRWGIDVRFLPEIAGGDVAAATQSWVDALAPALATDVVSWHMLQPVFVDDLDAARLERARARQRREDQA